MKVIYTLLILLIPFVSFGQESFQKDEIDFMIKLNDGYIISGNILSSEDTIPGFINHVNHPWVRKLNLDNEIEWEWDWNYTENLIGNTTNIVSLEITNDSSIVIGIESSENFSKIISFSKSGVIISEIDIPNSNYLQYNPQFKLTDLKIKNNIIYYSGFRESLPPDFAGHGIIRSISLNGDFLFEKQLDAPFSYPMGGYTVPRKILINDGFIYVASVTSVDDNENQFYSQTITLSKLNSNGEIAWQENSFLIDDILGQGSANIYGLTNDGKNNFILTGRITGPDDFVTKFTEDGNILFTTFFTNENNFSEVFSFDNIYQLNNIGIFNNSLFGYAENNLLKFDDFGNIEWIKYFDNRHFNDGCSSNFNDLMIVHGEKVLNVQEIEDYVADPIGFYSYVDFDGNLIHFGCTDTNSCNFDAAANYDDGSCIGRKGCIDILSCNFDSLATCDDYSCEYLESFIEQSGDNLNSFVNPIIPTTNINWYNVQNINDSAKYWLMAENTSNFMPTFDCSYFIIAHNENCSDTSSVYYYTEEARNIGQLSTYPNPTNGKVKVNFDNINNQFVRLYLINNNGNILDEFLTKNNELEIDLSSYPSGTYHITFNSPKSKGCLNEDTFQKVSNTIILNK